MKLTQCLDHINQALNYPALTFEDVSLFFDMAIAELNTTLHINIPTVSDMVKDFKQKMSKDVNKITITDFDPQLYPNIPTSNAGTPKYYYSIVDKKFYVYNVLTDTYASQDTLYGIYLRNGNVETYKAIVYGQQASWQQIDDTTTECDLSLYLPDEWVLLWLIPYVCFKYTVRDGGTASTFADELTQGFQQLQESYDVPERIILSKYADKEAYADKVLEYLPDLNVSVRTRAIYSSMKHNRVLNSVFGSMYDRGGF